MQGEDTERRGRRSTRRYVVDDRRAEILAAQFEGVFGAVDIRETLEGEPVKRALGLMEWASKKRLPMKALRAKAKKDGLGHYRPRGERPDPAEEYRRYLAFVRRKEEESQGKRGRSLSREELDALAREFYARCTAPRWSGYRPRLGRRSTGNLAVMPGTYRTINADR